MIQITLFDDQVILHEIRQLCRISARINAAADVVFIENAAGTRRGGRVDLGPCPGIMIVGLLSAVLQEGLETEGIAVATRRRILT